MDWNRAWENRALVAYYSGLIALRKQLPCLCDKTPEACFRVISCMEPQSGCAILVLDNSGGRQWKQLMMVFNLNADAAALALPMGCWQLLADGRDSFRWRRKTILQEKAELPPVSAMIFGLDG